MLNLVLTSSVLHLKPRLEESGLFRVVVSEPNKDGTLIFPDGEIYVRLPSVTKLAGRIVVLHAGAPHPNRGLGELEGICSLLRRAGKEAEVFFTYMPYSMQDKIHAAGETNAAENLLHKLVSYYGVKKIYAIDPHFGDSAWLSSFPFAAISAHELLLSAARKKYPDAFFVAPDRGHEARTGKLKGPEKTRADSYTVAIRHNDAFMRGLSGKTIGVVDDIIETGGTLVAFHESCMECGPKELFAVATHGVLQDGIARVTKTYGTLFLSNTIDTPSANVDMVPLIAGAFNA